jgi:phenylacetate-CoA ligase
VGAGGRRHPKIEADFRETRDGFDEPSIQRSGYSAEMDEAERASRDEIMALQTKRLAWTLAHAYDNVAHYKKAFDKAGVHPDDFKQLSDLAKFPFTVKTDLRDNYPFNMFAVPREKLVRVHASSGTTGKPIVVGYTRPTSTPGRT